MSLVTCLLRTGAETFSTFAQYFYYDHPKNGDLHEVVCGKFIAFKGPSDRKRAHTRRPAHYVDVFR